MIYSLEQRNSACGPSLRARRDGDGLNRDLGRDEFTMATLAGVLESVAAAGYELGRFDRALPGASSKLFYLRLDVDISPTSALAIGEFLAARECPAHFFFMFDSETYSVFSAHCLSIMKRLRAMGHCVGLHIDEDTIGVADEAVEGTVTWFNNTVGEIDAAVSFHRPSAAVVGRSYRSVVNAYDPALFRSGGYFSDSRFSGAFAAPLHNALREGEGPVQLLLHPVWWAGEGDPEQLLAELRSRRAAEGDAYAKRCFNKVFGEFIPDESRSFRV